MIHVLIVDDEVYCADGVKYLLDWKKLKVDEVYTAYSVKQAKQVFAQHEINIVLCDIEMPKGSGLDLLRWLKEQGIQVVSILLTSYATFNYAKQAIELGCIDYLLKPVAQDALEKVFRHAVDCVSENRKKCENTKLAEIWNKSEYIRVQNFWRTMLEEGAGTEDIEYRAKKENIALDRNGEYLPILIVVQRVDPSITWERETLEFAIKNIFEELVLGGYEKVMLPYNTDHFLAIILCNQDWSENKLRFIQQCNSFIESCQHHLLAAISCYIGDFVKAGMLKKQEQILLKHKKDNVTERTCVFTLEQSHDNIIYERPDIYNWMDLFNQKKFLQLNNLLDHYLCRLVHDQKIDANILKQLFHDFMQEFYITIHDKGIEANLLFQDEQSIALYDAATSSVDDFKLWVSHLINKAAQQIEQMENTDSLIHQVKKYIQNHLSEELSREQMADSVYLSPDYLSRVFRRETSMSMSEYITQERIREAKKLLSDTHSPIGEISFRVGYSNWAYFSKVFKEKVQMTPAQYRAQCRSKNI